VVDPLSSRELDSVRETIVLGEAAVDTLSAGEESVRGTTDTSIGVAINSLASKKSDLVGETESSRGFAVDSSRSRDFGLVGETAVVSLFSREGSAIWALVARIDVGNEAVARLQRRWVALTESRSPGEQVAKIGRSVQAQ